MCDVRSGETISKENIDLSVPIFFFASPQILQVTGSDVCLQHKQTLMHLLFILIIHLQGLLPHILFFEEEDKTACCALIVGDSCRGYGV